MASPVVKPSMLVHHDALKTPVRLNPCAVEADGSFFAKLTKGDQKVRRLMCAKAEPKPDNMNINSVRILDDLITRRDLKVAELAALAERQSGGDDEFEDAGIDEAPPPRTKGGIDCRYR